MREKISRFYCFTAENQRHLGRSNRSGLSLAYLTQSGIEHCDWENFERLFLEIF